ncbi:hypothetical protein IAU60_005624 [Kwoniella sp. DSM 27419]
MGFFSKRSKHASSSSSLGPHSGSSPNLHPASSRSSSSSPTPGPSSPSVPSVQLRVAIDPIPLSSSNEDSKGLFYVHVCPDESVASLRREIARTLGHGSMSLFKVSIPHQAHGQSRAYTERYGKSVDLLARFPAFNLDDPAQLGLSLGPSYRDMSERAVASGELKIKHWFPEQPAGNSEVIHVIARPLLGMPINARPLTLRAYFASPSPVSFAAGPSSRTAPAPVVIDVSPHLTVDELKGELLRASGRDSGFWKFVVLWQIAMTENEMTVIDELGRLRKGKMPWPYPPGAMEPIAMTDGNLPISLFFPRSAPNGDMLNLSVWLDPACGADLSPEQITDVPPFKYPMLTLELPSRQARQTLTPPLPATPVAELNMNFGSLNIKSRGRQRPSTAPAVVTSENGIAKPRAFGAGSRPAPRITTHSSPAPYHPSTVPATAPAPPKGLGIVHFPPQLDRTSFSSTISSEDENNPPSLNFSQVSLDTPTIMAVKTPDVEKQEWVYTPIVDGLKVTARSDSVRRGKGGSLRDRIRAAAAGSPLM